MITSSNKNTQQYQTKDGSIIRERVHPKLHHNKNQSLAEAIIPAHTRTALHYHKDSEEIYYVIEGCGEMQLNNEKFMIHPGDSIVIKPGSHHGLNNPYDKDLVILCCCSPAYSHEDTFLL